MSDARQAIAAAKEAGAATYAPDGLNAAEAKLAVAETDLQKHDYHAAHRSAVSAKDAALDALLKSRSRRDAAGAVPAAGAPAGSVPGGKAPSP